MNNMNPGYKLAVMGKNQRLVSPTILANKTKWISDQRVGKANLRVFAAEKNAY